MKRPSPVGTDEAPPTQDARVGVNLSLYNTDCGKFEIRLRPCVDIIDNYLTNVVFVLKWPENSVNIINQSSNFTITQQGNVVSSGGYNYISFSSSLQLLLTGLQEAKHCIYSNTTSRALIRLCLRLLMMHGPIKTVWIIM